MGESSSVTQEDLPEELERPMDGDVTRVGRKGAPGADDTRGLKMAAAILGVLCILFATAAGLKLASGPAPAAPEGPASASGKPAATPVKGAPAASAPANKKRRRGGNCLVASRGAVPSGCDRAETINDGITDFDGHRGYCSYDMNNKSLEGCLITLPKPVELSRIRFLLWDKDDRQFTYIAYVSPDGKEWRAVKDTSDKPTRSWQDIRFDLQPVKAVRIKGLTSTANSYFHVVEVEGYDDGPLVPLRAPPKAGPRPSSADLKPGLWAEYFDEMDGYATVEDRPLLARPEPKIDFGAMPPPQQPEQGLKGWPMSNASAAVFTGYIKIEKADLYTFFLNSDDGSKLYIDGEPVIDNDGVHGMTELWGQLDLSAGLHRVWITYFNMGGAMGLVLQYKPRNDDRKVVPEDVLFHDPSERETRE
ncbi:MAG: discoidin domain-containing protein [Planctomycetota bacterium]|nr:discoidin domain-containing protein [Planctomycetota bacterium]